MGVGPFSYDLSMFLFRSPPQRDCPGDTWMPGRVENGESLRRGTRSPARYTGARYANRVIWAGKAFIRGRTDWAFPELADVESQFQALDSA